VNSILIPTGSKLHDQTHTNKPLTEQQIRVVFQNSVFGRAFDSKSGLTKQDGAAKPSLTSQLLLLYYLLLYEDTRLNHNMAGSGGKQVAIYSTEFMSDLPIKYLLQQVNFIEIIK